jgi:hypothetical protein
LRIGNQVHTEFLSNLIAEVSSEITDELKFISSLQWDLQESTVNRGNVDLRYRGLTNNFIFNVGYRLPTATIFFNTNKIFQIFFVQERITVQSDGTPVIIDGNHRRGNHLTLGKPAEFGLTFLKTIANIKNKIIR